MHEHGYVLKPGDEGYAQVPRTLPCGWPGPQKPAAEWCIHDLPPGACSTCTGRGEEIPDEAKPEYGPWFTARFPGRCDGCDGRIHEGDQIRSDGQDGWLCSECGDDT
jgi:hypothetical protein